MKRHIRNMEEISENSYKSNKFNRLKYTIIIFFVISIFLLFFIAYLVQDLPSLEQLERYNPELATKIYSRDGEVIKELFTKKRILRPLNEMPEYLIQAVLDTEDRDFYDHWGLNFKRIIKALLIDIIHLKYKQGASTITQQLARQLYLNLEKSIVRK